MFIDKVLLGIEKIASNPFLFIPLLIYFIIITWIDKKKLKIPNICTFVILIYGLLGFKFFEFSYTNIEGLIIGLLLLLIPSLIKNFNMGGDVKTLALIGFYFGSYGLMLYVLIFITILAIVFSVQKKKTPLGPLFLITYILSMMLTVFI